MGAAKLSTLGLALMVLVAACGRISASSPSTSSAAGVLSCSLPVSMYVRNGGSVSSQSGFISVPSGTFTPDPSANSYLTYDRAYQRWLPVLAAHVLPDGSMYVYEVELPDAYELHVVQVANGADKMIKRMPYDNAYSILAIKPEGIYLVPILHRSGIPGGLWLLSSTEAKLTAVPGAGTTSRWHAIAGGAAWGGPVGGDRLDRLDLSTAVVSTWFLHDVAPQTQMGYGYGPAVVGFDLSGRPLIEFSPPIDTTASPARTTPLPEVWLVSAPDHATRLTGLPLPDQGLQAGVTDSHGTWFVGADGFYLYTDSGFRRAAPVPPVGNFAIAGECA
jgi:hypothetical protein